MLGFDMHVHTSASDGCYSAEEIVDQAKKINLEGLAITDHDTVGSLHAAMSIMKNSGYPIIPGIELSAEWEDRDVHILGYWIDFEKNILLDRLEQLQEERRDRCRTMVGILDRMGMSLDAEQIIEQGGWAIGRPHVARAMVDAGYTANTREAFNQWIGRGMPAYVPRVKFSPFEAMDMVERIGGVSVLAHPGVNVPDGLIAQLVRRGLGGIEVYHPEHNYQAERKYLQIAKFYHLAIMGGSDFHGVSGRDLGSKRNQLMQLEILARYRQ